MIQYRTNTKSPLIAANEPEPLAPVINKSPACCPSCGFSLKKDEIITLGDWECDPRGLISYKGRVIKRVTEQEFSLIHTLMTEKGRPISQEALIGRMGSESVSNIVNVIVHRARKILSAVSGRNPIANLWGRGYYWDG